MNLRVLLVEDDRELRDMLRNTMAVEGHAVSAAASVADAWRLTEHALQVNTPFDVVLLDLGLPDGDGLDLLHKLKQKTRWPVLVISAQQDEARKIRLLDEGADDFLVKPFGIGELLARMRVALRHRGLAMQAAITHYQHGEVTVDLKRRNVLRANQTVHLTPTEFSLLARLVRSAGQVVTHPQLLRDVWGAEHVHDTHYLRLYMGQLRSKLEFDPADPQLLLTETGVGYRLAEPDTPA